jgi:hypothetical protein
MQASPVRRAGRGFVPARVGRVVAHGALGLVSAVALPACSFDLEKLYTAGTEPTGDAGVDAAVPDQLIELFRNSFAMSDDCVACALDRCADDNASCRADADCTAFTACVAERDTPAQRERCRARFADWLGDSKELLTRDVNGPFGSCVLSQYCADVCRSHDDVSCLGNYAWSAGTGAIKYRLRLTDTQYAPVAGAEVRVCAPDAPAKCSGTVVYTTDDDGIVDVPLQLSATGSFVGYLEVEHELLAKQLIRFGWPVAEGAVMNLPVIEQNVFIGILGYATTLGRQVDYDTRGMVQVRVTGCSGVALSGAALEVVGFEDDDQVATWFAGQGDLAPSFTATETSDLGAGGIINIPPGRVQLRVTVAASGRLVSDLTVPIRAGYVTTLLSVPTID